MKIICGFICLMIVLPNSAPAQKAKGTAAGTIDQDYILALTAADQFMYAWATRNQDDGLALLSPRLKNKFPEDYFRYYLTGLSNPHHQAFEMGRGKRLPSGAFSFSGGHVLNITRAEGKRRTSEASDDCGDSVRPGKLAGGRIARIR